VDPGVAAEWALSNKTKNRLVHAYNGNTSMEEFLGKLSDETRKNLQEAKMTSAEQFLLTDDDIGELIQSVQIPLHERGIVRKFAQEQRQRQQPGGVQEPSPSDLKDLLLEFRMLRLEVNKEHRELSGTDGAKGKHLRDYPGAKGIKSTDGPPVLQKNPTLLEAGKYPPTVREAHLNASLTPHFTRIFERSGLVLVNSEVNPWLQQPYGSSHDKMKPDFFVLPLGFWTGVEVSDSEAQQVVRHRRAELQQEHKDLCFRSGIPADWRLRDALFILEGKVEIKDEHYSKMKTCFDCLRDGFSGTHVVRGMLYDAEKFALFAYCGGSAFSEHESGKWTDPGSEAALRDFFCADAQRIPWAHWLEELRKKSKVIYVKHGFLGMGSHGRVLKVKESRNNTWVAMKVVVGGSESRSLRWEFERLCSLPKTAENFFVRPLSEAEGGFLYVGDWEAAAMLLPLGSTPPRLSVTGNPLKEPVKQELLRLLWQLHCCGVTHGDARVKNVIELGGVLRFVDFSTASMCVETEIQSDVVQLVDSFGMEESGKWSKRPSVQEALKEYGKALTCSGFINEDSEVEERKSRSEVAFENVLHLVQSCP